MYPAGVGNLLVLASAADGYAAAYPVHMKVLPTRALASAAGAYAILHNLVII